MKESIWHSGMMGLIVGDALGVPVEFSIRSDLNKNPVKEMRAYGTHNQPMGTWSDDSSMALATLDSIREKDEIDYMDIMEKFSAWCLYGDYTPFQYNFDIGISTSRAIMNYGRGVSPLECGGKTEQENGNGSLMRILPICLHLYEKQISNGISEKELIGIIHNVSALTHGHLRSQIGCGLYYFLIKSILDNAGSLIERLQFGMEQGISFYRKDSINDLELEAYGRMHNLYEFRNEAEEVIKSSGYVVHTLEAAIWCMLKSDSYKEALLMAVNLGEDTDTVGAVTGGLAGLYYGYENIPIDWIREIQKKEWVLSML
ncbi:MAG: ADP-ribosylglycohydrolase family protein [Anaerocolumna sp.]